MVSHTLIVQVVLWGTCSGLSLIISSTGPVYEGQRLSLTCKFDFAISSNLKWTLNGSAASTKNSSFHMTHRDREDVMIFPDISLSLNNTAVMCAATTVEGTIVLSSREIILVEGLPMAVNDFIMEVEKNKFKLSWTFPFTLFKNSISFCIFIVTQVSRHELEARCGLKTDFTEYEPVDYGTLYEAIIIPVNQLGNGTSSSVFPSLTAIIYNCYMEVLHNTFIVQVECKFSETIVKGILVLLIYNDPSHPHKRGAIQALNTTRKSRVTLNGKIDGLHYITVHPILRSSNQLGTRIPFGKFINISTIQTDHPSSPAVSSTIYSVSKPRETNLPTTRLSLIPEVTTDIPTFFTFTNTATIIGCGSYILGLIPGIIIGVCCGYKLWRNKVEAYPLTPGQLTSAVETAHPQQIPPRLLSPLSKNHLSKLPLITMPPLHQPLPAINYSNFVEQTSHMQPSIVYIPPILPPITHPLDQQLLGPQHLPLLQSIPNHSCSVYSQSLADIAQSSRSGCRDHSSYKREISDHRVKKYLEDNVQPSNELELKNTMNEFDIIQHKKIKSDQVSSNNEATDKCKGLKASNSDVSQDINTKEMHIHMNESNASNNDNLLCDHVTSIHEHSYCDQPSGNFAVRGHDKDGSNVNDTITTPHTMENNKESPYYSTVFSEDKVLSTPPRNSRLPSRVNNDNIQENKKLVERNLVSTMSIKEFSDTDFLQPHDETRNFSSNISRSSRATTNVQVPQTDTIWPQTLD